MTIGTLAQAKGYRTAMVGKWHLGFEENGYDKPLPGGPVDRGFDSFFGIRASTDIPPYFYIRDRHAVLPPTSRIDANQSDGWSPIQGAFWRAGGIAPDLQLRDVLPRFTSQAVELIEDHSAIESKQPLMLYLAFPAPHTPWLPKPEYAGRSGAGMYGDFMVMVDDMIGEVLRALDKAGLAENTLVLFTSDNGPVWYDTDAARFGHDSTGGLRGMKGDVWEGGHRMPFIVRWPGRVMPGTTSRQTISFTDVLATFANILEVNLPDDAAPDSFSFLPVLEGRQPDDKPVRGPIVLESSRGIRTIRSGPWKLIQGLGSGGFTQPAVQVPKPGEPSGQLYHLGRDPGEQRNLYAEEPAVVARLSRELDAIQKSSKSR